MNTYQNNITIRDNNYDECLEKLKDVNIIEKTLKIETYKPVKLPNLISADEIDFENTTSEVTEFKNLKSVRTLSIECRSLVAPKLEIISGSLYLTRLKENEINLDKLKFVRGILSLRMSNISLPSLVFSQKIEMYEAKLKCNNLEFASEVFIYEKSSISAKSLSLAANLEVKNSLFTFKPKSKFGEILIESSPKISNRKLKRLTKMNPDSKWKLNENSPFILLDTYFNHEEVKLNGTEINKVTLAGILSDSLTAKQIFEFKNMEVRRFAFEKMDKKKLLELEDFKVIHEVEDDGYGHPMKLIKFKPDKTTTLTFLNCFCPSTGREYFLESHGSRSCWAAKNRSFGISNSKFRFTKEW